MKKENNILNTVKARIRKLTKSTSPGQPLTMNHIVGMAVTAAIAFLFAIQSNPSKKAELSMISEPSLASALNKDAHRSGEKTLNEAKTLQAVHRQNTILEIKSGDTLSVLLKDKGISPAQIQELITAARPVHNLGRLRRGQIITLDFDERDGKIYRFETGLEEDRLIVERQEDKLNARKEAFEFEIRHKIVSGTIQGSLFLAADEAGLPTPLILALADIFAWDIDFHVDIQNQDSFMALFEERCLDGEPVSGGRILAAGIVTGGKPYWAFLYEKKDGQAEYFDEEGQALRKAFLKSPLKYSRISSGYTKSRFHPILKTYRPHLGVDYAAPTGTPIRSVGDGKIQFAGWKGGYGKYMKIRHNGTYSSTYGHLQKFAKGIERGKHVRQGEVIGYVGATGMATGPHLDFRLLKNDKFINPLAVNFPDADPVPDNEKMEFQKKMRKYLFEMQNQGYEPPDQSIRLISLQLTQISS